MTNASCINFQVHTYNLDAKLADYRSIEHLLDCTRSELSHVDFALVAVLAPSNGFKWWFEVVERARSCQEGSSDSDRKQLNKILNKNHKYEDFAGYLLFYYHYITLIYKYFTFYNLILATGEHLLLT